MPPYDRRQAVIVPVQDRSPPCCRCSATGALPHPSPATWSRQVPPTSSRRRPSSVHCEKSGIGSLPDREENPLRPRAPRPPLGAPSSLRIDRVCSRLLDQCVDQGERAAEDAAAYSFVAPTLHEFSFSMTRPVRVLPPVGVNPAVSASEQGVRRKSRQDIRAFLF